MSPQDVAENAAPLLARIHPADIGSFFASAEESAKTMLPWHLEFRIDHPTKKEVWVEWQATPVREGGSLFWHGIMLDITERKTMQRRMKLLERAVNQSSDAVFLIGEELRFVYVNDMSCRSLGYEREELLGMTPPDINPDVSRDAALSLMKRALVGEPLFFESRHRARDGRIFPVEISSALVEFGGRRFSLTIARDFSERKRMLEELQRSERDFRSLAENVPDNIPRWDAEGRYLYINPTHEHALGVGGNQVRGKRISEVFPGGHFAPIDD